MSENVELQRASKKEIYLYSLGGLGSTGAFVLVMSFLTIFFVTVMKMDPMVVGTIFLVARLIDAVTDPMMGMITDRTVSKWGRFRPYMIFGTPILAITIIALFFPLSFTSAGVKDINPTTQIIFAYIAYIAYSLASTVVNIPFQAMVPSLSEDPNQRSSIVSVKSIGAFFGSLIAGAFTIPLVKMFSVEANPFQGLVDALQQHANITMKFGDVFPKVPGIVPDALVGAKYSNDFLLLDPRAWFFTAIVLAVIFSIAFLLSQWGAKDKDTYEKVLRLNSNQNRISLGKQLKLVFANKPLMMLMIAFVTDMIAFGVANGLNVYYWKEAVGNASYTSIITFAGLAAGLPFILVIPWLCKKLGKGAVLSLGSALTAAIYAIIYFMPKDNVVLLVIMFILATGTAIIPSTVGWAMLPDCVEYADWKHHIRGEGVIASGLTFVNKLGMALGGFFTGVALLAIGYDANIAVQASNTIDGIVFCRCILPVLGYICSVIAMFFYDLNNKKYMSIMKDLADRKASK